MQTRSVLLIDDHLIFLEGLRRILDAQEDLQVAGETDSVAGAVEQARHLRPDLVILDLGLRDGNGLDVLPQIVAECPETRVLALSGYGPENVLPALRLGARGFVSKDTASASLLRAIRAVLRGEIWAPRQETGQLVNELIHPGRSLEDGITPREQDVLRLVGVGKRNTEIARALSISDNTVKTHISSLMRKLEIDDRLQLTLYASRAGLSSR